MTDLRLEDIAISESLDYRTAAGGRGEQIIFKECPSCHNEKWKVYANAESGLGNCFACNLKFNLFQFAGHSLESKGEPHTTKDIGRYLHKLRASLGYRPKIVSNRPVAATVNEIAMPTSAELPYEDGWVHPYLLARGIDGHYAKMFALRWSAFGSNAYRNEKGETIKQSFANRIIIPVYDLDGVLVTYQGRDVTGTSEIRYRFAGGMPGTGRFLYHGHAARAAGVKTAVICEGVFDVIGAQKAIDGCPQLDGFAPIGTFGKHVSKNDSGPDQITALRRLARLGMTSAVFLWDAEPAAYQAALTASEGLLGLGLEIRVACLPRGLDPGEADARVIQSAIINALPATRTSLLRMRLKNPYA